MHQFDLKGVLLWHLFKRVFVKKKTTMRFDTFAYNKKKSKATTPMSTTVTKKLLLYLVI